MNWPIFIAVGALGVVAALLFAILGGAWAERHGVPPADVEPDYLDGSP